MSEGYFSDKDRPPRPRVTEEITDQMWLAVRAEIEARIENGSFGMSFPSPCPDGRGPTGTEASAFYAAAFGHVPDLKTEDRRETPSTLAILDFIQFCYRRVAQPIRGGYHPFFEHYHLTFDQEAGRQDFREQINLLFMRNGLAYELKQSGEIIRLAPVVLQAELAVSAFRSGDDHLDALLSDAVAKFLSPDPKLRKEALEKLWDGWERLKTLEGENKRSAVKDLLDKAAPEAVLRRIVEQHADNATFTGNNLMIRHTEVGKEPIERPEVVDYLFHGLFALIRFLLRSTGRDG
jgi:hypothetical protein